MDKPCCDVLLVEDLDNDFLLLSHEFERHTSMRVNRAQDGVEAIAYIQGQGKFADRRRFPFPQVLLLNLKLPRLDGFGVLRWLRANPHPRLTVIVLTGSQFPGDEQQARNLGAHEVFFKPSGLDEFRQMIVNIEHCAMDLFAAAR